MPIFLSWVCEFSPLFTSFLEDVVVPLVCIHPAPYNLLMLTPVRWNTNLVGKKNRTIVNTSKKSSQYKEWQSNLNAQNCPLILCGIKLTLQKHSSPHCILCHAWQHSTYVLDGLNHCSIFKLLSHRSGSCRHNHSTDSFSLLCFGYTVVKIPGSVWLIYSHWHLDSLIWNGIPA